MTVSLDHRPAETQATIGKPDKVHGAVILTAQGWVPMTIPTRVSLSIPNADRAEVAKWLRYLAQRLEEDVAWDAEHPHALSHQ